MNSSDFSTFCHISQYGNKGYRALRRMIAMSQPCLWAPSSVLLKSDLTRLSPTAFLRYVEKGEIRIFGRHEWLHEPEWRNSRPWPDAAWDNTIDGTIRRICLEDEGEPKEQQRVAVAPPENGYSFAESYLDANPQEISRWTRILSDKKHRLVIPSETREAALRDIDDNNPKGAVRRVLRDAYNHGQAFSYSGADAPLLVEPIHKDFLKILADAPPLDGSSATKGAPEKRMRESSSKTMDLQISAVAGQLIEFLQQLDLHARDRGDVDSLDGFIRGQGRRELMRWMRGVCDLLKYTQPRELNGLLLVKLRSDFGMGRFPSSVESLFHGTDEAAVTAVGMASTLIGLTTDPRGTAPLMGLGATIYALEKGFLRQIGWAPDTFTGPQWPFIYAYGTRPKRKQRKQLLYVLNELFQRELPDAA